MDLLDAKARKCICSKLAEFKCQCKSETQYFCSICAPDHIKDINIRHKLQTISTTINEPSRRALILYIKDNIKSIKVIRTSISAELTKAVSLLQKQASIAFRGLMILNKNLKSLLVTINTSPQYISKWNIKRILSQNPQETAKELSSLKLFSVILNTEALATSWITFEDNYEMFTVPKIPEYIPLQASSIKTGHISLLPDHPRSRMRASKISALFCKINHKLVWSYSVLLECFLIKGPGKVQCNMCSKKISKPCWHCSECFYEVCEECGNSQGVASPKIVCDKGHELFWKCTSVIKYKTLSSINIHQCNKCYIEINCPSWHCDLCNFNLCKLCASEKGALPIEIKDKCILKHILKPKKFKFEVKCNGCSNKIKYANNSCDICDYKICEVCSKFLNQEIAQDPILSCHKGHLLRWSDYADYTCDVCARKFESSSFYCKTCDLDVCYECSDYLEYVNRNNVGCKDMNGHQLERSNFVRSGSMPKISYCYSCDYRLTSNCLVFSCLPCQTYICILCFRKNENAVLQAKKG